MKKIKLLTPILGLTALAGAAIPLVSCACVTQIKPELSTDSSTGVKIKSSNIVKGKESTIELEIPTGKEIDTIEIKIGNKVLTKGTDYTIDENNKITIKADSVDGGNVSIRVIVKDKATKVTEEEWKAAHNEVNYLDNSDANMTMHTISKATMTTEEGPVEYSAEADFELDDHKYHMEGDKYGTTYGLLENGILFKLTKEDPTGAETAEKYYYLMDSEEPNLPYIDYLNVTKEKYSDFTYDGNTNTYSYEGYVEALETDVKFVITIENKKITQYYISFKMNEGKIKMENTYSYSKIGSTTLAKYPKAAEIEDKFVNTTYDEATKTWTSPVTAIPTTCINSPIFVFDVKDKLLKNNTITFTADSGATDIKSILTTRKAFIMQNQNLVSSEIDPEPSEGGEKPITWNNQVLTINQGVLINDKLFVQFYMKNGTADNFKLTFKTSAE